MQDNYRDAHAPGYYHNIPTCPGSTPITLDAARAGGMVVVLSPPPAKCWLCGALPGGVHAPTCRYGLAARIRLARGVVNELACAEIAESSRLERLRSAGRPIPMARTRLLWKLRDAVAVAVRRCERLEELAAATHVRPAPPLRLVKQ